ncbi:MAG: sugar phosphate isomerase/epimerase family protein [Novosphingobium sp.]
MANLGIELISVFGMPPVKFVELAAELGCPNISMGLNQMDCNPYGYPRYSIPEDAALRREIRAAAQANGVTIALGENLTVLPDMDCREMWQSTLDILGELGVTQANSVSFEPDFQRNVDQYGALAELSAACGIRTLIEFVPIFGIADVRQTLDLIAQVGHPNLGLIFDTMHAGRTGFAPEQVATIPPELIGYIQICDAPRGKPAYDFMDAGYMDEAMHERLSPGHGDLPLADYLRALPDDLVISLEIPRRSEAEAGKDLRDILGRCVADTQAVLASL